MLPLKAPTHLGLVAVSDVVNGEDGPVMVNGTAIVQLFASVAVTV
jgi:hypothetical protein